MQVHDGVAGQCRRRRAFGKTAAQGRERIARGMPWSSAAAGATVTHDRELSVEFV